MRGVSGKRWVILSENIEPPKHLIEKFGRVVAQILTNRNFENYVDLIFNVKLKNILPYKLLPNIEEGAFRIKRAIEKGERIVIFGDYDVDGITATAILYDFLKRIKARVVPVIPSRNMGYGLNQEMVKLFSRYADLVITVDNGTSSADEIRSMGIDVVIIDHHNPSSSLPEAIVINPKISEDTPAELKEISSAALSFYMIASLRALMDVDIDIRNYIDMVAIGTVADVMPLNYLNRIFVIKGIELLNSVIEGKVNKPGIKALLDSSGIEKVSFRDISFSIAPKLNSAGRIGDPKLSLNLLIEKSYERARFYARKLEALNISRKRLSENILREACELLDTTKNFLCVSSSKWHTGVLGIVAGRIAREFSKPCGIFKECGDKVTGSVRSVEGIDIHYLFSGIKDMFLKWGGHSFALGVTIPSKRFGEFRERVENLLENYRKSMGVLEVDMELDPKHITGDISEKILALQPFGEGNSVPTFTTQISKYNVERVSKNRYKIKMDSIEFNCFNIKLIEALRGEPKKVVYSFDGEGYEIIDVEAGNL